MMEVVLAAFTSTGLFGLIQFFVTRHDQKKGKAKQLSDSIESLKKKIDRQERDSCRTQLLLLMSDFPENTDEILKIGQHYFQDLKANWYMSTLFATWCKKNNIELPDWAHNIKEDDK